MKTLLNFNPAGYSTDVFLYRCPILLSFLCLLVREEDIDLSSNTIDTFEIYVRMLRCIYKKFIIHKGIEFRPFEFVRVMMLVGRFAFLTLLSGNILLLRSDVLRDVGEDAFECGFLIGHEDFRLIQDETTDIFVTFPHQSLQVLLGAFYFILMLTSGISIFYLLGRKYEEPIFLTNPLFLHFSLWLLRSGQRYFDLENTSSVYVQLVLYSSKLIDSEDLTFENISKRYPALNILGTCNRQDTLVKEFLSKILDNCKMTKIGDFPNL